MGFIVKINKWGCTINWNCSYYLVIIISAIIKSKAVIELYNEIVCCSACFRVKLINTHAAYNSVLERLYSQ